MRQLKLVSTVLITSVLVACGGGGSDVPAKPKFTAQVSFGDSLSDVGSYRVANIGSTPINFVGQFTINAAPGVSTNWTQMTAVQLGVAAPCAAAVGGFGVARAPVAGLTTAGCYGYAQGGARVTSAAGVGNTGPSGPMTEPVATQVANHLVATGNKFTGSEIVTVMAGANDVFTQAGMVGAGAIAPASAVAAVQTAATELAALVNTQLVANGAKYVVLVNVPDIASTPQATPATAGLLNLLVTSFNATLKAGVPDSAVVLNVDAYTASKDEVANPTKYNLSNVSTTACNLNFGVNPLATSGVPASGSSLACNATNLSVGVTPADHYLFADKVHPTPYGHLLFATYVLQAMTNKGWY
jgi:outer membrane lipase/esterase